MRKYRFLAKDAREKDNLDAALQYYQELLRYSPDDAKAWFWTGKILYDKQDLAGARQALSQAAALDSLYFNTNLLLFQIHSQDSRPDSAAPYLERVLRLKPDEAKYQQYRRNLADLFYRTGNARQALYYYLQVAAQHPDDPSLAEVIATTYEDLGEPAEALAWRQKLLAQGSGSAPGSQRQTLRSMAELQIKTGDTKGAFATLNQLLQLDPDHPREALEPMAELQIRGGDTKGAFATLMQLVQVDSLNRYTYYSRIAQVGEKAKDAAMQVKGLEGMAQTNPKDVEAVITLVEWHLKAGNDQAAERAIQRGLRIAPAHARLNLLRGDFLSHRGADEEALAAYEKAKADPAWVQMAQERILALRPPESQDEKSKRELFHDHFKNLAEAGKKNGDDAMMVTGLEGMVQNRPRDIEPMIRLAEWYLKADDPGTAIQWVARGLEVNQRDARLLLLKGDCLARQGAAKEALAAFEKAKADTAWAAEAVRRIRSLRSPEGQDAQRK
ncbi:MAG: tetratricopeptide repeat protein [Candidatus Latescibacteria bacterium]|nr:tetratricopeptide repeat protein [Candidatus Latescibacterota bacterium]